MQNTSYTDLYKIAQNERRENIILAMIKLKKLSSTNQEFYDKIKDKNSSYEMECVIACAENMTIEQKLMSYKDFISPILTIDKDDDHIKTVLTSIANNVAKSTNMNKNKTIEYFDLVIEQKQSLNALFEHLPDKDIFPILLMMFTRDFIIFEKNGKNYIRHKWVSSINMNCIQYTSNNLAASKEMFYQNFLKPMFTKYVKSIESEITMFNITDSVTEMLSIETLTGFLEKMNDMIEKHVPLGGTGILCSYCIDMISHMRSNDYGFEYWNIDL